MMRSLGAALAIAAFAPLQAAEFVRGDANGDRRIDIADAVCALTFLFGSTPDACKSPGCLGACDANDDGQVNIADPITVLAHLFAAWGPLPPPFPACGLDPTLPALPCDKSPCPSIPPSSLVLEVPAGMALYYIWSEGYNTVEAVSQRLAVIELREGQHELPRDEVSRGARLIETLRFGPDLEPAAPRDDGTFTPTPAGPFSHEYRQSFTTPLGAWTFVLQAELADAKGEIPVFVLDCAFFDTAPDVYFRAELDDGAGARNLYYSCFLDDQWHAASGFAPATVTLEDGAVLALYLEDAWIFRGVAGETANRRLARADVTLGGRTFTVVAYQALRYAARHHNWNQEYRIILTEPVEGIHAIDLIECPGEGCMFTSAPQPKLSKAYYLDATGARMAELDVVDVQRAD